MLIERVRVGALFLTLGLVVTISSVASQTLPVGSTRALRIIVVESADEAQSIRARLLDGDDFTTLAEQLSIDPSADRGGLLGRLDLSALLPELREAVQGLATNQISGVVPVPTGFAHLIA